MWMLQLVVHNTHYIFNMYMYKKNDNLFGVLSDAHFDKLLGFFLPKAFCLTH